VCLRVCLNILAHCNLDMVKTLTIKEDVYRKLVAIKKQGESFSDLFERLAKKEDSASALEKLRASVTFKAGEKDQMISDIYSKRSERRR
jgi:predicted CopG family antitoxin